MGIAEPRRDRGPAGVDTAALPGSLPRMNTDVLQPGQGRSFWVVGDRYTFLATGEDTDTVLDALANLKGVNGRLEIVGQEDKALVVVDYAHKPEALQAALQALRPFATGRLICVFGCGGDRDRGKRPIMGRIATDFADVVIVTDDNPRTESPPAIRAEILAGAPGAEEIGDRRAAIETAIDQMRPGDVVLIAGKGHETGQIVGDTVLPFSDHDVAREALARRSRNRTS